MECDCSAIRTGQTHSKSCPLFECPSCASLAAMVKELSDKNAVLEEEAKRLREVVEWADKELEDAIAVPIVVRDGIFKNAIDATFNGFKSILEYLRAELRRRAGKEE